MANFLETLPSEADLKKWAPSDLRDWFRVIIPEVGRTIIPGNLEVTERFTSHRGHHFHKIPEVFIQLHGSNRIDTPGNTIAMYPGDALIMPRGVPHRESFSTGKQGFAHLVFTLNQDRIDFHMGVSSQEDRPRTGLISGAAMRHAPQCRGYLEDIISSRNGLSPLGDTGERALWQAACGMIHQALSMPETDSNNESPRITWVRHYIQNHISDSNLTVSSIASVMHCSADYLSHRFHTEVGQRFSAYLRQARLAFAQELLIEPELSVSEIAFASGFQSSSYFIRVYRQHFGVSPGKARKR